MVRRAFNRCCEARSHSTSEGPHMSAERFSEAVMSIMPSRLLQEYAANQQRTHNGQSNGEEASKHPMAELLTFEQFCDRCQSVCSRDQMLRAIDERLRSPDHQNVEVVAADTAITDTAMNNQTETKEDL